MAFIRTKRVKGKPYAYLVENAWEDGSARQRVKQYLGRVHEVSPSPPPGISVPPEGILEALLAEELRGAPVDVRIEWETKEVTDGAGTPVVLSLNGGHLCGATLTALVRALHTRNEERPGTALAEALSRAGLRMPKEAFVRLYLYHNS